MELIASAVDPQQREGLTFEKLKEFKYLGTTLSKNDWSKNIRKQCMVKNLWPCV